MLKQTEAFYHFKHWKFRFRRVGPHKVVGIDQRLLNFRRIGPHKLVGMWALIKDY